MFRIYYHLYLGASWSDVWALHRPELESFARAGLLDILILCIVGSESKISEVLFDGKCEIRRFPDTGRLVNEFQTLQQMHQDANDPSQIFDYCAYMHSKGASSKFLNPAGREWSLFLSSSLLRSLPSFEHIVRRGFNCLGSNLALGIFEDFGPPRLHYSGNFWGATRELIASSPKVSLESRYSAVRHNAEWWIGKQGTMRPFNVFSTGLDHYSDSPSAIDWTRLESRVAEISADKSTVERSMATAEFIAAMIRFATGGNAIRAAFSNILLQCLPYHRWRWLLTLHGAIMRRLGSRKWTFFYCPESR